MRESFQTNQLNRPIALNLPPNAPASQNFTGILKQILLGNISRYHRINIFMEHLNYGEWVNKKKWILRLPYRAKSRQRTDIVQKQKQIIIIQIIIPPENRSFSKKPTLPWMLRRWCWWCWGYEIEARWRERQRSSFSRLNECASLSSTHSAQMMMGPWISPTLALWPAFYTVEENSNPGKNSPLGQITNNQDSFSGFYLEPPIIGL